MNKTSLKSILINKLKCYKGRGVFIMEKTASVEERIRRAEEIYQRRRSQGVRVYSNSASVMRNSPSISLFKKMIIKIIICIIIYSSFYLIKNSNYFFSQDVINKTSQILSYDMNLQGMFNDIKKYFMSNSNKGIELSMNYQYPATLFKLNGNFNTENCVVEAYKKLCKELFGKRMIVSTSQKPTFYTEKNIYYSGVECLNAASHMINKELQGEAFANWFRGITSAIKKLYEHRKMILISMNYIYTKWNICMNDDTLVYINQYTESLKKVEKWVNLALHYELTKNKRDLEVILKELPDVYDVEKDVLGKYVYHTIDWEKYNLNFI